MDLYFARHDGSAATVRSSCSASPISPAPILPSSCSGTRRPEPRKWSATGSHDAARKSYRLDLVQTVPASPDQPSKEPMVIPLAIGLVGADGCDCRSSWARGRRRPRGADLEQAGAKLRLRRYRGAARPLAQPGLFGADQARGQPVCRRVAISRDPGWRRIQPMAGLPDPCHAAARRECNGAA